MEAHGCACTSREIFQFNNKATGVRLMPLWFCWPNRFSEPFLQGREGGLQHSTRCSAVSPTVDYALWGVSCVQSFSIFFFIIFIILTHHHTHHHRLLHAKKQRAASPLDTRLSKLTQRHRHPVSIPWHYIYDYLLINRRKINSHFRTRPRPPNLHLFSLACGATTLPAGYCGSSGFYQSVRIILRCISF